MLSPLSVRRRLVGENDLPLACVILDIDDFKEYNDHWGHEVGDEALRWVARLLKASALTTS